ncbi:MAG: prohibitin family protein [Candidatus Lokiarchaeota archaeon]|nr:prohibitin family protein [Candidatus Lokiarchaeota archaeon]
MRINADTIITGIVSSIVILVIITVIGIFTGGFLSPYTIIPAGETGVYVYFGNVDDKELKSGFHLKNPLASVKKMSIRTEEYTMSVAQGEGEKEGNDSIDALTKEGLTVKMDITVFYAMQEDKASDIYKTLGLNYEEKIIRTEIRSSIRAIAANYEAKDLYSEKRDEVEAQILISLKEQIEPRGITIENALLRNIILPNKLTNAISDKLEMEQQSQKMEFVLEKEKLEAERKAVEAEGIKKSQDIISESLTPAYVRWYSIEMMKDLAGSENTTFLFVPTDNQGMPVVNFPIN